jgi:hypothetical protein
VRFLWDFDERRKKPAAGRESSSSCFKRAWDDCLLASMDGRTDAPGRAAMRHCFTNRVDGSNPRSSTDFLESQQQPQGNPSSSIIAAIIG